MAGNNGVLAVFGDVRAGEVRQILDGQFRELAPGAQALSDRGDRHDAYREIRGRYQRAPGGGLRLRVDRATRADGGEVAMDLLFDLAAVGA